ncbi:MAG: response regulator [Rhodoferax sp.]|nr:response regulator [Rhodoferax sp.]MCF8208760.1 response regulator [Rhodoferax sp.]
MKQPEPRQLLLVEDEPGDAGLMQFALKKSSFPIALVQVPDGRAALNFLTRQGEYRGTTIRPDLILLDLKMPGLGGLDTLEAIKRIDSLRAIPVVVVTTSGLESDVARAYQLGAAGYINKPADLNAFVAAVGVLCSYWCGLVRLPELIE